MDENNRNTNHLITDNQVDDLLQSFRPRRENADSGQRPSRQPQSAQRQPIQRPSRQPQDAQRQPVQRPSRQPQDAQRQPVQRPARQPQDVQRQPVQRHPEGHYQDGRFPVRQYQSGQRPAVSPQDMPRQPVQRRPERQYQDGQLPARQYQNAQRPAEHSPDAQRQNNVPQRRHADSAPSAGERGGDGSGERPKFNRRGIRQENVSHAPVSPSAPSEPATPPDNHTHLTAGKFNRHAADGRQPAQNREQPESVRFSFGAESDVFPRRATERQEERSFAQSRGAAVREPRVERAPIRTESDIWDHDSPAVGNDTHRQAQRTESRGQADASFWNFSDLAGLSRSFFVKTGVLVLCILVLSWLLPSGNIMFVSNAQLSAKDRDSFYSDASENLLATALSEVHSIPRTFKLDMCEYLTPQPDQSKYSKIEDDTRKNYDGSPIDYYKDATIEVKCWKEKNKYGILSFAEVWIAHPSQFRRTIVDNVISKKHKDFPENIFRKTNGILGMSGDYCAFRPYGIEIQYGKLIRDKVGTHLSPKMDVLVYDINGNFSIYESTEAFYKTDVYKNNEIIHTLAFGPMLIDDYKVSDNKVKLTQYQNGAPSKAYPRAAICQFDYEKHYLLCRLGERGCSLENFAKEIHKKGVRIAYALDGGQTGTILFNKKLFNEPAYGGTREMSDIIYFATAVPEE